MVVASTGNGHTEVVVHNLKIRSNSKAVENRLDPNVLALDQYVSAFRLQMQHDFGKSGLDGFTVHGATLSKPGAQGVSIRARDRSGDGPVSLSLDTPVAGEFDVTASLESRDLPVTDDGSAAAELALKISDGPGGAVSLVVFRTADDAYRVEARSSNREQKLIPANGPDYSVIASADAASVEQLRVIRIQKSLLFVFSEGGVGRLLGQTNCVENDLPPGAVSLRATLPPGDAAAGEFRWTQFSVSSLEDG